MQFVVEPGDYPLEIHKAGCRDVKDQEWIIEGDTAEEARERESAELNRQFDNTYPANELFRLMPCTR